MKFCTNCGAPRAESKFCTSCGADAAGSTPRLAAAPAPVAPAQRKVVSPLLVVGATLLVLVIVGGVVEGPKWFGGNAAAAAAPATTSVAQPAVTSVAATTAAPVAPTTAAPIAPTTAASVVNTVPSASDGPASSPPSAFGPSATAAGAASASAPDDVGSPVPSADLPAAAPAVKPPPTSVKKHLPSAVLLWDQVCGFDQAINVYFTSSNSVNAAAATAAGTIALSDYRAAQAAHPGKISADLSKVLSVGTQEIHDLQHQPAHVAADDDVFAGYELTANADLGIAACPGGD